MTTSLYGKLSSMTYKKKLYVIAEAGVNHNGSLKIAHDLIRIVGKRGISDKISNVSCEKFAPNAPRLLPSKKIILNLNMKCLSF